MLSFRIRGGNSAANRFCEATRIFTLAESLGGVESLIEVPASMTHMGIPKEQREAAGVFDDLVRISCGVEVRFFFSFFPLFTFSHYIQDILTVIFTSGLRRSRRRHFTSFGKSGFYFLYFFYEWNFFFYDDLVPTLLTKVEIRHVPSTSTSRHQNFFFKKKASTSYYN